ncbi:hypothetical protein [Streptomyces tibetensis]|uniref:hypothetical protein n=1 Tax=Streptomyces tibetensis TaxID=2382123 RepID=UPI0033CDA82C
METWNVDHLWDSAWSGEGWYWTGDLFYRDTDRVVEHLPVSASNEIRRAELRERVCGAPARWGGGRQGSGRTAG